MKRQFVSCTVILALVVLASGCSRDVPAEAPYPRLVTFSPALTKLVFDMGLGTHVVGVTGYCRPPEGEVRPIVGDNLNVRAEPLLAVRPDVLLVQMELRHFAAVRKIRPDLTIEHFTIETLTDIARAMARIGQLTGNPDLGLEHKKAFLDRLEALRTRTESLPKSRVCFLMGYRNPSGPGKGTFIDQMITLAGGANVLAERFEGWRSPGLETIMKLAPELIICQCKPGQEDTAADYWRSLQYTDGQVPRVVTVTDDDWTLPAGHLAEYAERLAGFIHPEPDEEGATP